jgi:hypothetical protein
VVGDAVHATALAAPSSRPTAGARSAIPPPVCALARLQAREGSAPGRSRYRVRSTAARLAFDCAARR